MELTYGLGWAGNEATLKQAVVQHGTEEVTKWAGGPNRRSLLHASCGRKPSPVSAERLLKLDADPNSATVGNQTPMHYCASYGTAEHQEIARCLIRHGADLLLKDVRGMTALDLARTEGHAEMARLLLETHVESPPAAAHGPDQVRSPSSFCSVACARRRPCKRSHA